jgi:hypothetical protein
MFNKKIDELDLNKKYKDPNSPESQEFLRKLQEASLKSQSEMKMVLEAYYLNLLTEENFDPNISYEDLIKNLEIILGNKE